MSAEAAKLLDELMGRHRNLAPDEKPKELRWDSDEMCHFYLGRLCPHDLFNNTKADLGACKGLHDEDVRNQFRALPAYKRVPYEDEYTRFAQSLIGEIERKIRKSRDRLELKPDDRKLASLVPPQYSRNEDKLAALTEKINKLVEQAETLGCDGKVEEAQGIMKLCDNLRQERDELKRVNEASVWHQAAEIAASQEKQMDVCDICGSFLIVGDAQQRIDDHLSGKIHRGYAKLRDSLEEMRKEREEEQQRLEQKRLERRKQMEEEQHTRSRDRYSRADNTRDLNYGSRSSDRRRSRDRDLKNRDHDRERVRDRERRSHDRDRSRRSRDRDRDRRSRDRDRSRRSRDRSSRDRDRSRRSRDRDKGRRSRDRDHKSSDRRNRSRDRERRHRSRDRDSRRSRDGSEHRRERRSQSRGGRDGDGGEDDGRADRTGSGHGCRDDSRNSGSESPSTRSSGRVENNGYDDEHRSEKSVKRSSEADSGENSPAAKRAALSVGSPLQNGVDLEDIEREAVSRSADGAYVGSVDTGEPVAAHDTHHCADQCL